MNSGQDKNIKGYGRVMSRVYNRSQSNLKATSSVLSHVTSTNSGAKRPSVSSVRTGVFSDLPIVLNDYVPDTVSKKDLKQSTVVKPRRTLKSLVPGKKPLLRVERNIKYNETNSSLNVCASAPSVLGRNTESCPDSHVRHCLSSRSHSRLKELKDEIKSYQDTEQLLKLRSRLYKRCGVVLNDVGQVAADKAVQSEDIDVKQDDFRKDQLIFMCVNNPVAIIIDRYKSEINSLRKLIYVAISNTSASIAHAHCPNLVMVGKGRLRKADALVLQTAFADTSVRLRSCELQASRMPRITDYSRQTAAELSANVFYIMQSLPCINHLSRIIQLYLHPFGAPLEQDLTLLHFDFYLDLVCWLSVSVIWQRAKPVLTRVLLNDRELFQARLCPALLILM
ncbi:hypothetical protein RR46_03255 [Papilio xuthus]|uniref:Uncharacterized protein n=1 Tax=Papilio xuthus TaxID=66420 RepID=A0A194QGU8_PAPXU|nr:hypothetical protein RR46_03255 [Papilio xuthus]